MKFFSILCLNLLLLFANNSISGETILSKTEILKKSNECFKDYQKQICEKFIMQLEKIQFIEFKLKKFRCQSSILGLQSELVEANFFENSPYLNDSIMIPYVIKNC